MDVSLWRVGFQAVEELLWMEETLRDPLEKGNWYLLKMIQFSKKLQCLLSGYIGFWMNLISVEDFGYHLSGYLVRNKICLAWRGSGRESAWRTNGSPLKRSQYRVTSWLCHQKVNNLTEHVLLHTLTFLLSLTPSFQPTIYSKLLQRSSVICFSTIRSYGFFTAQLCWTGSYDQNYRKETGIAYFVKPMQHCLSSILSDARLPTSILRPRGKMLHLML